MESTKCAGFEVVNVVCKVQAHHTNVHSACTAGIKEWVGQHLLIASNQYVFIVHKLPVPWISACVLLLYYRIAGNFRGCKFSLFGSQSPQQKFSRF